MSKESAHYYQQNRFSIKRVSGANTELQLFFEVFRTWGTWHVCSQSLVILASRGEEDWNADFLCRNSP
jgi:hypothetical protein